MAIERGLLSSDRKAKRNQTQSSQEVLVRESSVTSVDQERGGIVNGGMVKEDTSES